MSQAKQATLEQAVLPQLLFRQCVTNCVDDSEAFSAETAAEKLCLANCQSKTYAAFDMFVAIKKQMAGAAVTRSVDVSRYTGMEVEHGHNTGNLIEMRHATHVDTAQVDRFTAASERANAGIRAQALGGAAPM